MKTFVVVYHKWWMDSGSFTEETIDAESLEIVERYASANCYNKQSTFKNWAYHIVEIDKLNRKSKLI